MKKKCSFRLVFLSNRLIRMKRGTSSNVVMGHENKKMHRSRNKNGLRCVYRRTVDEIYFDCVAFFAKNQRVGTYAEAM